MMLRRATWGITLMLLGAVAAFSVAHRQRPPLRQMGDNDAAKVIIIPEVNLASPTQGEIIRYLRTIHPQMIVEWPGPEEFTVNADTTLMLDIHLHRVTLEQLLKKLSAAGGLKYDLRDGVIIAHGYPPALARDENPPDQFVTQTYGVRDLLVTDGAWESLTRDSHGKPPPAPPLTPAVRCELLLSTIKATVDPDSWGKDIPSGTASLFIRHGNLIVTQQAENQAAIAQALKILRAAQ